LGVKIQGDPTSGSKLKAFLNRVMGELETQTRGEGRDPSKEGGGRRTESFPKTVEGSREVTPRKVEPEPELKVGDQKRRGEKSQ